MPGRNVVIVRSPSATSKMHNLSEVHDGNYFAFFLVLIYVSISIIVN